MADDWKMWMMKLLMKMQSFWKSKGCPAAKSLTNRRLEDSDELRKMWYFLRMRLTLAAGKLAIRLGLLHLVLDVV